MNQPHIPWVFGTVFRMISSKAQERKWWLKHCQCHCFVDGASRAGDRRHNLFSINFITDLGLKYRKLCGHGKGKIQTLDSWEFIILAHVLWPLPYGDSISYVSIQLVLGLPWWITMPQKKLGKERVYLLYTFVITEGRQGKNSNRIETWRKKVMYRQWRSSTNFLALQDLLILLFYYRTHGYKPRGGYMHNGLAPPTTITK